MPPPWAVLAAAAEDSVWAGSVPAPGDSSAAACEALEVQAEAVSMELVSSQAEARAWRARVVEAAKEPVEKEASAAQAVAAKEPDEREASAAQTVVVETAKGPDAQEVSGDLAVAASPVGGPALEWSGRPVQDRDRPGS